MWESRGFFKFCSWPHSQYSFMNPQTFSSRKDCHKIDFSTKTSHAPTLKASLVPKLKACPVPLPKTCLKLKPENLQCPEKVPCSVLEEEEEEEEVETKKKRYDTFFDHHANVGYKLRQRTYEHTEHSPPPPNPLSVLYSPLSTPRSPNTHHPTSHTPLSLPSPTLCVCRKQVPPTPSYYYYHLYPSNQAVH